MQEARRDPRLLLQSALDECQHIQRAFVLLNQEHGRLRRRLWVVSSCLVVSVFVIAGLVACLLQQLGSFQ